MNMMLMPRRNFDLFDEMFEEPFFGKSNKLMKTDIKESDKEYTIEVDLPGYTKDNIKISVDDGYLTVNANISKEDNDTSSKYVRKERYYGQCSRSFYVGDNIETEDVKASFHNGILKLSVPKKETVKELPEKKYVQIED